jgi:Domain of unknown function (DUF6883)
VSDCIVENFKVLDYLLNPDHPHGAAKARFFIGGGFRREARELLVEALRRHFRDNPECRKITPRPRLPGASIIVDAPMLVPDGRRLWVRTVWVVDGGETIPRLVFAYPKEL